MVSIGDRSRCICHGLGVNSTAMTINDLKKGRRIDLVTTALHGMEKRRPDPMQGDEIGTYDFIPVFTEYVLDHGGPKPEYYDFNPVKADTQRRYREGADFVVSSIGLEDEFTPQEREYLWRFYGNNVANKTLPSLAYNMKACSQKVKLAVQEPGRIASPALVETWKAGYQVIKCLGFDAGEDHRIKDGGTYAIAGGADYCPVPGLPRYRDRYEIVYPLRDDGIDRAGCKRIISEAGLPIPSKSACFACPATKMFEIQRLAIIDPALYCLSIAIEMMYRIGPHFYGDRAYSVNVKDRWTSTVYEPQVHEGDSVASVREEYRKSLGDSRRRKPGISKGPKSYRYEVTVNKCCCGLNFGQPWMLVPVELEIAYVEKMQSFAKSLGLSDNILGEPVPCLTPGYVMPTSASLPIIQ